MSVNDCMADCLSLHACLSLPYHSTAIQPGIVPSGQHVKRFVMPRSSYPLGKVSYLQWREDLKKLHASTVTQIMREEGFPQASIDKVCSNVGHSAAFVYKFQHSSHKGGHMKQVEAMILKKLMKVDPEAQVIEDALCLGRPCVHAKPDIPLWLLMQPPSHYGC